MPASNVSGRHREREREREREEEEEQEALRRGCSRNVRSRDKYRTYIHSGFQKFQVYDDSVLCLETREIV